MRSRKSIVVSAIVLSLSLMGGCAGAEARKKQTDLAGQSAVNGHIDFDALAEYNEEIFAWLYVPGTDIDMPIAQSAAYDGFYEAHNWKQEEAEEGCAYTEMANLTNMCDFNTVVHLKNNETDTAYTGLYAFSDKDFFDRNGQIYVYLPDNVLTYQVVAVYQEPTEDIIRSYDLVSPDGCDSYIQTVQEKAARDGIYREDWEELTYRHFLLTLVTQNDQEGMQEVVTAVLVQDAAGTIDRIIYVY